ncbi:MAG: tRNA uridine-5-carboxymethylaminomethyl(34) synthesis GTPase MnmE [Deltaproteobacteria bacterium]|nr:tRNA uridine-5-carboxymethylaminomethyl(34) synthesis GTPase MnmE [Deltaproteobacteria bacterium]
MASLDLDRQDTICALSTAPGIGAIAMVRVSGPNADDVLLRCFRRFRNTQSPPKAFVATLGEIVDDKDEVIDEALCTRFPEGKSYTGEASFELSLHGGPSRVRATLASLLAAGCRLAGPGEFTLRAVLTGRLDLTSAEAVDDVISARSDEAARAALRNLHGGLRDVLAGPQLVITDTLAELEARMDFPDEDLPDAALQLLVDNLEKACGVLQRLLDGARLGARLSEGARVVLYGLPNAGKSTLLNALVGEERALVHDVPGTTRDVLEAECVLGGIPVTFVDVAGVRDDEVDAVEAMGIARAREELQRADVLLLLAAADESLPAALMAEVQAQQAPHLVIRTKRDLLFTSAAIDMNDQSILLSAKEHVGLKDLREKLADLLRGEEGRLDEVLLSRGRQREEVALALDALQQGHDALAVGEVDEVITSELRQSGKALARLLGSTLDEDVLNTIFSRFCIGK